MIRRKFIPEKASELLVSMCDGLEFALNSPGLYRINMGTFGEPIGEDDICMGASLRTRYWKEPDLRRFHPILCSCLCTREIKTVYGTRPTR